MKEQEKKQHSNLKSKILERIVNKRKSLGLRQTEIAEFIGISSPNYCTFEKGKMLLTIDKLLLIAKKLNTTIEYLICGDLPTSEEFKALQKENEELKFYNNLLKKTIEQQQ